MNKSIIIVDDQISYGESLRGLINTFTGFKVEAIYSDGIELKEHLSKTSPPDLILLDIRMPKMDGVETMQWLREEFPNQKVIALTLEDDEEILLQMLTYGCRGYLLKDIDPLDFEIAINKVILTGYFMGQDFIKEHARKEKFNNNLSDREIEFLQYVCTELTYKEIAAQMNLSPKTIDGYRESLFSKLNIKSRVGLAVFAIKNKFYQV